MVKRNIPKVVETAAGLATLRVVNDGVLVQCIGSASVDDGLGFWVHYRATSTATVNGTTVFNGPGGVGRYIRIGLGDVANKAPLASPAFTGVPTAPTAAPGTNTTQVATTAFVLANAGGGGGGGSSNSYTPSGW